MYRNLEIGINNYFELVHDYFNNKRMDNFPEVLLLLRSGGKAAIISVTRSRILCHGALPFILNKGKNG